MKQFAIGFVLALLAIGSMAVAQNLLPKATAWQVNVTCTPPANTGSLPECTAAQVTAGASGCWDTVAGYFFLRAPSGSTSYAQLNATATTGCGYTDTGATPGATWNYIAESVDAQGNKSVPSNMAAATIPAVLTAGTLAGKTT
jgi:hypothetical protein